MSGRCGSFFFPCVGSWVVRFVGHIDNKARSGPFRAERRCHLDQESFGGDYRGIYTVAGDAVAFTFADSNLAGPWLATGALRDGTLTVRYNVIMPLADFEDAIYQRTE